MNLLNFDMTPFSDSLMAMTNSVITQPNLTSNHGINNNNNNQISNFPIMEEESFLLPSMKGGNSIINNKKNLNNKKKSKQIDTYKKDDLINIAKLNNVSLKTPQKLVKTKQQLFESLKRKKLI